MEHSKYYEKIKFYYINGNWNKYRVCEAVVKGWITQEECDEILGVDGE